MKQCPQCQRATLFSDECVTCGHVEPTFMERYGNALASLAIIVAMTFVSVVVLVAVVPLWPLAPQVPPAQQGPIMPVGKVEVEAAVFTEEPVVDAGLRAAIRAAMSDKTALEIMQLHLEPEPELTMPVSFMSADGFRMEVTPEGKIIAPKEVQE